MRIYLFIICCCVVFISCKTYVFQLKDGSEVRYAIRSDKYKWNKMPVYLYSSSFNEGNIGKAVLKTKGNRHYEILHADDIRKIAATYDNVVVVSWYTCGGLTPKIVDYVSYLQGKGYIVLLVSVEYDLRSMDDFLNDLYYDKLSYILPVKGIQTNILRNNIDLIKSIDRVYYNMHKDEVMNDCCLFLNRNGEILKSINFTDIVKFNVSQPDESVYLLK